MDSVMKGLMAAMPPPQNFWARTAHKHDDEIYFGTVVERLIVICSA